MIAPLIGVRVGSSEFLFRAGTAHYVCLCTEEIVHTFANLMVALGSNERERTGRDGAAMREHYV